MTQKAQTPRSRRLMIAGFILALAVAGFFAVRLTVSIIYWSDPAHHNQTLEGWMTPRYVAQSWDLPPEVVRDAFGIETGSGRRISLDQIARDKGMTLDDLVQAFDAALTSYRSGQ